MTRPRKMEDDVLICRLSHTFRAVGYEGASLARLAEAAGMQGPSLYHRFPGGKRQMAKAVLDAAGAWYGEHVFSPLAGPGTPAERVANVVQALDIFYAGGKQACLLNLMAQPPGENSPFAAPIRAMFGALIDAFAAVAQEAGAADPRPQAQRAVALLHGSLVLARGMGSPEPFKAFTATLGRELGVEK